MKKNKLGVIVAVGLSAMMLAGCGSDAEYFSRMKNVKHVKVIEVDKVTHNKTSYTEVVYEQDGKKLERRFAQGEDHGFHEYINSAKLFKRDIYIDMVVDNDGDVVVASLSDDPE